MYIYVYVCINDLVNPAEERHLDVMKAFMQRGVSCSRRLHMTRDCSALLCQIYSARSDGADNISCRLAAISGTSMSCPIVAGAAAMVRPPVQNIQKRVL